MLRTLRAWDMRKRVYHAAERLRRETDLLRPHLRPAFADEFKHVDAAVDSILNNLAEGSDSIYPGKKLNFFDIARNSANEAGGGLRSLGNRKAFGDRKTTKPVTLAYTIRKMIQALIEQVSGANPPTRSAGDNERRGKGSTAKTPQVNASRKRGQ